MAPTSFERHKEFGKHLALQGEDSAIAASFLQSIEEDLCPRTFLERTLVQDLTVNIWRQNRVRFLENEVIDARREEDPTITDQISVTNGYARTYGNLSRESRVLEMLHRFDRDYSRETAATLRLFLHLRVTRHAAPAKGEGNSAPSSRLPLLFDPPGDPDAIDWDLYTIPKTESPETEQNESEQNKPK